MSLRFVKTLKDRPKIMFRLTRDSVCMADDVDAPHEKFVELPSAIDPMILALKAANEYLPKVSGNNHIWTCLLNSKPIATLHGNFPCKPQVLVKTLGYQEDNIIHFSYESASHP